MNGIATQSPMGEHRGESALTATNVMKEGCFEDKQPCHEIFKQFESKIIRPYSPQGAWRGNRR
jgi:hypothetical protein